MRTIVIKSLLTRRQLILEVSSLSAFQMFMISISWLNQATTTPPPLGMLIVLLRSYITVKTSRVISFRKTLTLSQIHCSQRYTWSTTILIQAVTTTHLKIVSRKCQTPSTSLRMTLIINSHLELLEDKNIKLTSSQEIHLLRVMVQ